jgi:hypothetical protein
MKHDSISLRDKGKLFSFPTAAIHCSESKEIVGEVNVLPDNNKASVDGGNVDQRTRSIFSINDFVIA